MEASDRIFAPRRLLVIGFCGKAKAGKDSAATAIADCLNSQGVVNQKYAFADPIREIGKIFGFSRVVMDDQSLKENWKHPWLDVTPRKFMQLVGSEMFRNNLNPDVWVKHLKNRINKFEHSLDSDSGHTLEIEPRENVWSPKAVVLITDVRFPNEVEMIKRIGGFVIRVERTNNSTDDSWRNHESEKFTDTLKVDATIYNNQPSLLGWCGEAVLEFSKFVASKNISFDHSKWVTVEAV